MHDPCSDDIPARQFPVVNVALTVANFAVCLFYELPNGDAAVNQAAFYCGLIHTSNTGGSTVAFCAHVGGFIFGAVVARVLVGAGCVTIPAARWSPRWLGSL